MFEQLLSNQVTQYVESYMNNNITAYREKKNCHTILIKLVEDWKRSLDDKKVYGVL